MIKIGDQFRIIVTDTKIRLKSIKDRDDKKKKLSEPIYFFEYLEVQKPQFSTYLKEVNKMLSFNRWEQINT